MDLVIIATGLALVALGFVGVWLSWRRVRRSGAKLSKNAEKTSAQLIAQAELEAQRLEKDGEIQARERLLTARTEFERETREYRLELDAQDSDLRKLEEELGEREGEQSGRAQELA
ncbi:MAG: DUF3552 domain-containing protein, partial [bacterium]|nr:DUF3552 domain-containing protein [bacterium]